MIVAVIFELLCCVTDCVYQKIDRRLLAVGYCLGIGVMLWRFYSGEEQWYSALTAVLPGIVLWGLCLLTEEKIGRGDGDMVLILGLLLGGRKCVAVLCAASLLSAVYAGVGLIAGKLRKSSRIAFAPFLLAGILFVWLFEAANIAV